MLWLVSTLLAFLMRNHCPQSVCNRCVIELFCGVVCVVTLPFWHFCWCRGFCHRTESDLFLFLSFSGTTVGRTASYFFKIIWYSRWFCNLSPHFGQCLALFAVAEGRLLLDPGWFVLLLHVDFISDFALTCQFYWIDMKADLAHWIFFSHNKAKLSRNNANLSVIPWIFCENESLFSFTLWNLV